MTLWDYIKSDYSQNIPINNLEKKITNNDKYTKKEGKTNFSEKNSNARAEI